MPLTCPYCQATVTVHVSGAAECEHCGGEFRVPGMIQAERQQVAEPPRFIVVSQTTAPRPHRPRLKPQGWFARAFATTSGILLAILAVNVIGAILALFVFVVLLEIGKANRDQPPSKAPVSSRR